jgi:hypothetical protein
MNDDKRNSPWRQPIMWLVVGLPAITVIALVSLVIIAAGPGSTDSIDTSVQRTGRMQTADLGPDQTAARLQLSALLRIDRGSLEVLPLHAGFDTGRPLRLAMRHPARADLDREFVLQPSGGNWRAPAPTLELDHDWTLQLAPEGGAWRLQGRLVKGQLSARLQPVAPG